MIVSALTDEMVDKMSAKKNESKSTGTVPKQPQKGKPPKKVAKKPRPVDTSALVLSTALVPELKPANMSSVKCHSHTQGCLGWY